MIRYRVYDEDEVLPFENGEYVLFADHEAEIARVREDERANILALSNRVAESQYAAALRDAVEAVKAQPWTHDNWMCVDERKQAVAAIEALSEGENGGR